MDISSTGLRVFKGKRAGRKFKNALMPYLFSDRIMAVFNRLMLLTDSNMANKM